MTGLLLKATPALLDGWCGPVVWDGCPGMLTPHGELYATEAESHVYYAAGFPMHDAVRLDLARAEARDRVVRMLAQASDFPAHSSVHWAHAPMLKGWMLSGAIPWSRFPKPVMPSRTFSATPDFESWGTYPALADLDPNDDTRLPDGSRLVDAQALLAVAMDALDIAKLEVRDAD